MNRPDDNTRDAAASPAEAAARLDRWFGACPAAAVAFSGGVDSALVAAWARDRLGRAGVAAWIADSPSLRRDDLALAQGFCRAHDIDLRVVAPGEIDDPAYARNAPDRCFHCKTALYRTVAADARRWRRDAWLCSGANRDDAADYRPGLVAATEAAVRHPLLECGLGKSEVRALARMRGLSLWDKPASPCLSSRIPYGEPVTTEKLRRIEAAEAWLHGQGFAVCRVRHVGGLARVEVPPERIEALRRAWADVAAAMRHAGFADAEIDEEGFVSGKLNRAILRPGGGR